MKASIARRQKRSASPFLVFAGPLYPIIYKKGHVLKSGGVIDFQHKSVLPDLLVDGLVSGGSGGGGGLLALSVLVVELGFAVDGSTKHSDGHTSSVKQVDGHVEEYNAEGNGQALLEVTANSHGEGTSKLVGVERRDVEQQSEETVSEERGEGGRERDVARGDELVEAANLTGRGGASQSLESSERRHAEKELDGRQGERASHESVGDDGLLEESVVKSV